MGAWLIRYERKKTACACAGETVDEMSLIQEKSEMVAV
jgi:hypothetical protein